MNNVHSGRFPMCTILNNEFLSGRSENKLHNAVQIRICTAQLYIVRHSSVGARNVQHGRFSRPSSAQALVLPQKLIHSSDARSISPSSSQDSEGWCDH